MAGQDTSHGRSGDGRNLGDNRSGSRAGTNTSRCGASAARSREAFSPQTLAAVGDSGPGGGAAWSGPSEAVAVMVEALQEGRGGQEPRAAAQGNLVRRLQRRVARRGGGTPRRRSGAVTTPRKGGGDASDSPRPGGTRQGSADAGEVQGSTRGKATAQREEAVPRGKGARQPKEADESDQPGLTTLCAGKTGITWLWLLWFAGWCQVPRPQEEPEDASCLSFTAALPPIGQCARPQEPRPTGSRHRRGMQQSRQRSSQRRPWGLGRQCG